MNYYYYYFLSATIRCQLNCHSYTIIPEEKPFLWNGVGCLERHLRGHNHLLEIRLLKTGFLSRFQPNPKLRCLVLDNFQKKKFTGK
jgi:hypothetical protein